MNSFLKMGFTGSAIVAFLCFAAPDASASTCPGTGASLAVSPAPGCQATTKPQPVPIESPDRHCPAGTVQGHLPDGTPICKRLTHLGKELLLPLKTQCPTGSKDLGEAPDSFQICQISSRNEPEPLCDKGQMPIIDYEGTLVCNTDAAVPPNEYYRSNDGCPLTTRPGFAESGAAACYVQ